MKNFLFCFNCQKQILISELKKQTKMVKTMGNFLMPKKEYLCHCKKCGQESYFNPDIIKLYQNEQ